MKIALAVGIKGSNDYLNEYVSHYLSIGFDTVIIYDNNEPLGENPMDVLQEYQDNIIYIDARGERNRQRQWNFYTDVYRQYGGAYDWIAFFDDDEMLFLNVDSDAKQWLSRPCFNDVDVIGVNWRMMSDNGLIRYENKPLKERFTEYCDSNATTIYSFPQNKHIKSIVHCSKCKTDHPDLLFKHPHFPKTTVTSGLITVDASGNRIKSEYPFCQPAFEFAELRHYQTKSTEEFCIYRLTNKRYYEFERFDGSKITLKPEISYYFKLNKWTQEKQDFIDNFCEEHHLH